MIMSGNDEEFEAPMPLPEAVADTDDHTDLENATIDQDGDAAAAAAKARQKKIGMIICLAFILSIIGLVIGLVANRNNGSDKDSSTKTSTVEDEASSTSIGTVGGIITKIPSHSPTAATSGSDVITPWVTPSPSSQTAWSAGSENPDEFGACETPTTMLQPVVDDRGLCTFQKVQTVSVDAPVPTGNSTVVEKKLSGGASAFDGDNAVIVSYNADGLAGAVWALSKISSSDGNDNRGWEQTAVVQTDDEDQLGWGVSIKGDIFAVGAPGHNGTDIPLIQGWYWAGVGRAVIMAKNEDGSNGWYEQAVLEPGVADDNAAFGSTLDIAECGCLIAVGAWHDRDSRGSVYVFSKSDNGEWTEIQKLAPTNTRRSQSDHLHGNFGYTVAINNDYLAVKAPYDSYVNSYASYDANRGMVHIYKRNSGDGTYEKIDQLCTPEGSQVRAHLTDMIFLDDFLLVGAPAKNKVYVFQRKSARDPDAVGYEKTAELTPSGGDGTEDSNFGIRLDGSGANVLVGDLGGKTSHLFSFEDGVWKEKAKFDGVNTSLSGNSIVEHTPKSFEVDGEKYGGEVNFYDLVCEDVYIVPLPLD